MNYYVLFHIQNKTEILLKRLKEIEGFEVLYPMMEYYRRDIKGIALKPSFPGYVFVKTEMEQDEFDIILNSMNGKESLFKQLKKNGLPALSENEIILFESLYDKKGILRMSYGGMQNKRLLISEGPLKNLERFIKKVDIHNKQATLNVSILDTTMNIGLWLR